jgi:hypothetical protein
MKLLGTGTRGVDRAVAVICEEVRIVPTNAAL